MVAEINESPVLHIRFDGRSFDVPLSDLDVGPMSSDAEVKRALAGYLNVPDDKLRDYTVDRHETGNLQTMVRDALPCDLPSRLKAAWPPGRWRDIHVLAAVSGGADSIALLRALLAVKQSTGGDGRVMAAHVNHKLRGASSDEDAAWLVDECRRLDVPLVVRTCDAQEFAIRQGDGVEAAARRERYRLLVEMAEGVGARFVATAHTCDDQVETVLFRILRGTGLRGLGGMRPARALSRSVTLVRPLLAYKREDMRTYLAQLGQAWREDGSNADLHHRRNRIRVELLPYLREHFNAEVDAALLRLSDAAVSSENVLESLADDLLAQCRVATPESPGRIVLLTAPLANQPETVTCSAIRRAWREAGWPEQAMTRRQWRELAALAAAGGSAVLSLPGDIVARRNGEHLVLAALAGRGGAGATS